MNLTSSALERSPWASRLRSAGRALLLALALAPQVNCATPAPDAEADEVADDDEDDGDDDAKQPSTSSRDAGTKASTTATRDAATSARPARDASSLTSTPSDSLIDAGMSAPLPGFDELFGPDSGLWAPPTPPGPAAADNPKECPPTAPENPIGSCIGVPVYATCNYGSYSCLCDWIHWLCI